MYALRTTGRSEDIRFGRSRRLGQTCARDSVEIGRPSAGAESSADRLVRRPISTLDRSIACLI
jgi:hypothetical protein